MPSLFRKVSPLEEYNVINFSCLQFVKFSKTVLLFGYKNIYSERKTCSLASYIKYSFNTNTLIFSE